MLGVVDVIPVGSYPSAMAMRPDEARLFVANQVGNSVSVIVMSTNNAVGAIAIPDGLRTGWSCTRTAAGSSSH